MSINPLVEEALNKKGPFSLFELTIKSDLAEEILEESGQFFWSFDSDGERQFVSREAFFKESRFSLHFSREEIEGLYLVAPGRFIPFTPLSLPLVIDGQELPMTEKKISASCLKNVLSLDNGQTLLKALQQDRPYFLSSLEAAADFPISVYDLESLKEDLHQGTHLDLKMSGGVLKGTLVQSDQLCLDKVKTWCEALEKSFIGVLREFGPFMSVDEQLALAYFYGAATLREEPSLALRDFIELSPKLAICDFGFRRLIWFKEELPADSHEALTRAQLIKDAFTSKVNVCWAFYRRLPSKSKRFFSCDADRPITRALPNQDLDVLVRRCALWIENSQDRLSLSLSPTEELIMFEAIFLNIQQLCTFYDKSDENVLVVEDFSETISIISRMLQEVCELLQIYYCCELS